MCVVNNPIKNDHDLPTSPIEKTSTQPLVTNLRRIQGMIFHSTIFTYLCFLWTFFQIDGKNLTVELQVGSCADALVVAQTQKKRIKSFLYVSSPILSCRKYFVARIYLRGFTDVYSITNTVVNIFFPSIKYARREKIKSQ